MSKKCLTSLLAYALFTMVMLIVAYVIPLDWRITLGVAAGIMVIASILTIISRGDFTLGISALVPNAAVLGLIANAMFALLNKPPLRYAILAGVMPVAYFALFCFLTELAPLRERYKQVMPVYGAVPLLADIIFAFVYVDVVAWLSLLLLIPFVIFYASLVLKAENGADTLKNCNLLLSPISLAVTFIASYFKAGKGALNNAISLSHPESGNPFEYE